MNETLHYVATPHGRRNSQNMDGENVPEERYVLWYFPSYLLGEMIFVIDLVPAHGFLLLLNCYYY